MRGKIQGINHDQGSGIATLTILDEFGDICVMHVDAWPLLRAITDGELNEGDVIEFRTIYIGTISESSAIADGNP